MDKKKSYKLIFFNIGFTSIFYLIYIYYKIYEISQNYNFIILLLIFNTIFFYY